MTTDCCKFNRLAIDIGKLGVVDGYRCVDRPILIHIPNQVRFHALDVGIGRIFNKGKNRDILWIEPRDLHIGPLDEVDVAIELDASIGQCRFPAKLNVIDVVGVVVRGHRRKCGVHRRDAAATIPSAWPVPFRNRRKQQDIVLRRIRKCKFRDDVVKFPRILAVPTIDVVVTASVLVRHTDARGALEDSVAKIRRTFKVNFKIVASHPDQGGDLIA